MVLRLRSSVPPALLHSVGETELLLVLVRLDVLKDASQWRFLVAVAAHPSCSHDDESISLLGAADLMAGVSPFVGLPGLAAPKHRVPIALSTPPLVLAAFGLLIGVYPAILDLTFRVTITSVLGTPATVHLSVWHGFGIVLSLSSLTLVAAVLLYVRRDAIHKRIWPRSLDFELGILIGFADLRLAKAKRSFQRGQTEAGLHRVG